MIESVGTPGMWGGFLVGVAIMLLLDLGVFNKKTHAPSIKEALGWSVVWISIAMLFNLGMYHWFGKQAALEFFTGYVIEKSLSVDNLFVFVVVFSAFKIPRHLHHKVLFWGILGAIFFRIIFIMAGAALISKFHFIMYVFGAFLVYTGFKIIFEKKEEYDPNSSRFIIWAKKIFPIDTNPSENFTVKINGKTHFTYLFLAAFALETTDIIFAVDSIPAIFAVTQDPFIVFTSNIFAILGLRSLYFLLADFVDRFVYLNIGLGIILGFVGIKICIMDWYHIPTSISLGVVFSVLAIAMGASLLKKPAN